MAIDERTFKVRLVEILQDESARLGIPMSTILYELIKEHELANSIGIAPVENKVENAGNIMIAEALRKHGGNQRRAAMSLGMSKSTFHDRARRLGLTGREDGFN